MKSHAASVMLLFAVAGAARAQPTDIARDHASILAMQANTPWISPSMKPCC